MKQQVPWANLPSELIAHVHASSEENGSVLRLVCTSWRDAITSALHLEKLQLFEIANAGSSFRGRGAIPSDFNRVQSHFPALKASSISTSHGKRLAETLSEMTIASASAAGLLLLVALIRKTHYTQ